MAVSDETTFKVEGAGGGSQQEKPNARASGYQDFLRSTDNNRFNGQTGAHAHRRSPTQASQWPLTETRDCEHRDGLWPGPGKEANCSCT